MSHRILKCGIPANRTITASDRGRRLHAWKAILTLLAFLVTCSALGQQLDAVTTWATDSAYELVLHQNVVYQKADSVELKLDVISGGRRSGPRPVLMFFHGGGWVQGKKEGSLLKLLPFVARGMAGVNVEYRLASEALAPAAVEDCRCALHWVVQHAKE